MSRMKINVPPDWKPWFGWQNHPPNMHRLKIMKRGETGIVRNWKRLDLCKPPVDEPSVLLCGRKKDSSSWYKFPLFELGCFAYNDGRLFWYGGEQPQDVTKLAAVYRLWWCPVPAFDGA